MKGIDIMSLMICNECGGKVASTAAACPTCGNSIDAIKEATKQDMFKEKLNTLRCPKCGDGVNMYENPLGVMLFFCNNKKCWNLVDSVQLDPDMRKQQTGPHCPTCNSTNIKKITTTKRITHGAMFGLFSKTARSQWECKNCGNKW